MNFVPHNVLLPKWINEKAKTKDEYKTLVLQYMQRYPEYTITAVRNGFAVCTRN